MKTRLETLIAEAQIQATEHPSKDARFFAASVHRYLTGQPAHNPVPVEHCLWARNGNAPCPHASNNSQQPPVCWLKRHKTQVVNEVCFDKKAADDWVAQFEPGWAWLEELRAPQSAPQKTLREIAENHTGFDGYAEAVRYQHLREQELDAEIAAEAKRLFGEGH